MKRISKLKKMSAKKFYRFISEERKSGVLLLSMDYLCRKAAWLEVWGKEW